ncbi:hypothetical protein D3C72_2464460 [compost metagenome]
MWFAVGEIVIAKIKEGVRDANVHVFQAIFRVRLNVAVNVGVFFKCREHRFIAQRAAAEQRTNILLLRFQAGANFFDKRPVQRV